MTPQSVMQMLQRADFALATGRLTRISRDYLEADGPYASVGDYCEVETAEGGRPLIAEVVSVEASRVRLVPVQAPPKLSLGAAISRAADTGDVPVGNRFGGRAVDGLGEALDGRGSIPAQSRQPRTGRLLSPLDRISPREPLRTGIRAIDALLPIGRGQRLGIFAAAGVGKTSLIEQIARHAPSDRTILCLVGERGREVERSWQVLGSENGDRFTLVAATADESASLRVRAIEQAIALAEFWREQGEHVLLIVDSVTRVAQALREIGIAAGLPPGARGLTPNVFSALPRLVERCGASRQGGTITAILTVLSETDDIDDLVAELMKSVLDGHILLSRPLAERQHFPAIDVSRSVSRLAGDLLGSDELKQMRQARALIAAFEEARPMIESGLYRSGTNAEIDRAIALQPALSAFLRQDISESEEWNLACGKMATILAGGDHG